VSTTPKEIVKIGSKTLAKGGAAKVIAAVNPAECLEKIVTSYCDYRKIAEQETTKRQAIAAWKETQLADIEARRELLISYLEHSFDERRLNFKRLFEIMDAAVAKDDTEMLSAALASMTQLALTSPFKDLASVARVRATLDEPDGAFEI